MSISPSSSPPMALTIAGSDSGGGAGIQADIKTFAALGVFGCSAITAITAQNTEGVDGIWAVAPAAVAAQIHSVLSDLPIQSIKTGMLYQPAVVEAILSALASFARIPLVVDPVLVATSGDALVAPDNFLTSAEGSLTSAEGSLVRHPVYWQFLKMAHVVTPNLDEAAQLLDTGPACTEAEMQRQGKGLIDAGLNAVLIKGGHLPESHSAKQVVDILLWRDGGRLQQQEFRTEKIHTDNTHGTGCTLSAAIAAELAKGQNLNQAVAAAKHYLTQAIEHAKLLRFGCGSGPVQHFFNFNYQDK